jgi:hypothetical protein
MLAEIFMLRLEDTSRNLKRASFDSRDNRFEPILPLAAFESPSGAQSQAVAAPTVRMSDR